jgi:hypothetical protein
MNKEGAEDFFFLCFLCERTVTKSFKHQTYNITHCHRCAHKIPVIFSAFQAISDEERTQLQKYEGAQKKLA